MTKEQSIKWAPEIAALQAGKVVQSRSPHSVHSPYREWAADFNPCFSDDKQEFRVKPEPREVWLAVRDEPLNPRYSYVCRPSQEAWATGPNEPPVTLNGYPLVRFVEVVK